MTTGAGIVGVLVAETPPVATGELSAAEEDVSGRPRNSCCAAIPRRARI